jgi:hypothetical protein
MNNPIQVKLTADPLNVNVKMAPEEESSESTLGFKIFFITILVIAVLVIGWGLRQVLPRNVQSQEIKEVNFPLRLTIDEPMNATLRDELPVTVTVQNTGADKLTLSLSVSLEPSNAAILSENGLTAVEIKDLPPGGVYTHVFKFLPLKKPEDGVFQPVIRAWNGTEYLEKRLDKSQIWVIGWPPYLRLLLKYILTTSGVVGALVGLAWERIKKALGE